VGNLGFGFWLKFENAVYVLFHSCIQAREEKRPLRQRAPRLNLADESQDTRSPHDATLHFPDSTHDAAPRSPDSMHLAALGVARFLVLRSSIRLHVRSACGVHLARFFALRSSLDVHVRSGCGWTVRCFFVFHFVDGEISEHFFSSHRNSFNHAAFD
jgi:hypothetical protein